MTRKQILILGAFIVSLILITVILSGCAAAPVVSNPDPHKGMVWVGQNDEKGNPIYVYPTPAMIIQDNKNMEIMRKNLTDIKQPNNVVNY